MYGMLESKYTIELRYLLDDKNFELFDFEYKYLDGLDKKEFEKRFKDTYYFYEIGFETIARFKHELRSHLNNIMPKFNKLYKTELESNGINFLLNKDLIETYERSYTEDSINNSTNNSNSNSNNNSEVINSNIYKESSLDNGNATLNDLTSASKNDDNSLTKDIGNTENNSKSNHTGNNKISEKTKLESKGNIGTTSSAELLKKYREIIVDYEMEIIESCKDLFILIYS